MVLFSSDGSVLIDGFILHWWLYFALGFRSALMVQSWTAGSISDLMVLFSLMVLFCTGGCILHWCFSILL